MKKIIFLFVSFAFILGMSGCYNQNSYSYKSRQEKKLISNYISRMGIELCEDSMPSDSAFLANPKLYYKTQTYYGDFYYRLDKRGDSIAVRQDTTYHIDAIVPYDIVVLRYKQYTLEEPADTISRWSTLDSPFPTEFSYLSDYQTAPYGWHYAVGFMGYSGSECTCIIPSRSGTSQAQNSVTPYGYKISMKIKR